MFATLALSVATLGWVAPAAAEPAVLSGDPAALLPANTILYFGTDSVKAGADAARQTAMAKILNEAEVRAFLHQPLGAAEGVLKAMMSEAEGELGGMPGGGMDDGFLRDMVMGSEPTPVGQAFLAMTHLGMPGPGSEVPDMGLVLGIELLNEEHVGLLRGMWSSLGDTEQTGTMHGIDFMSRQIPDAPLWVHLAFVGDLAVITLSEKTLNGVLERASGGSSASLATSPEYAKLMEVCGGAKRGGSVSMVRIAPLVDIMQMGLMAAAASEMDQTEMQAMMKAMNGLGLRAIQMVGGTSYVAPDGLIHSTSVAMIDPGTPGLVSSMLASEGKVDLNGLESIPGDTLGASMAVLGDQLVQLYDYAMDIVGTADPSARQEAEGMISAFLGGSSLRDDLLGNFHGQMASFSIQGQGFSPSPDYVIRAGVKDGDALVTALGNLASTVSREAGMPVKLKTSDHEGHKIHELDLSATPLGMQMQPAFSIDGEGNMVFSTTLRQLKSQLNASVDSSKSLAANEGLKKFLAGAGGMDIQSLSFTDVKASFKSQYGPLAGMAPFLMSGMGGDIPVDFTKLPPSSVIEKHLTETYTAASTDGEGLYVNRAVAQFQLGDVVPLAAIAGLIALGAEMGVSAEVVEVEEDPVTVAMKDLKEIRAALTVYKIAMKGYPENLEALVQPIPAYESGALPRDELPLDPWGQSYRFAMEEHPKKKRLEPKLWSIGPNGVDENGEGDDILRF